MTFWQGKKELMEMTLLQETKWVPIKREEASIYINKFRITSPAIRWSQFPVMSWWTYRAHKAQGLSLSAGVISFDLQRQRSSSQEQIHVDLSRVRVIKNLYVIRTYNRNAFQVNSNVRLEYYRLRDSSYFVPFNTVNKNNNCLTVSLLSTRSFRKHAQDMAKAENLMENDVFCLTEIQICQENNMPDIKQKLDTYEVNLNLEDDRHQNIRFYLSKSIKITNHESFLEYQF